jgi:hypothetical protein
MGLLAHLVVSIPALLALLLVYPMRSVSPPAALVRYQRALYAAESPETKSFNGL